MSASAVIKKWIFVLIPLIVVGLAAAVIGLGFLRTNPQIVPPPQQVRLDEIKLVDATPTLKAVALVEANQSVDLKARVSGFLIGKHFEEGREVKAGQTLFRIEPDQYQAAVTSAMADVTSAQAQLDKATLDFNRAKDLYTKKSSPKSDFDTAQAALDVAQATLQAARARLAQAKLNLDYATIKAPFDGSVSSSPFSVGSLVGPESGALATVVSKDPVEVTFGLSDKVMSGVRLGNERSGLPGSRVENVRPRLLLGNDYYEHDGEISYVSPQVDRQTDTVRFKVRFKNPDGKLAPGQAVVASLEPIEPRKILMLPKPALMTGGGASFVYLAEPGEGGQGLVAAMRPVTVGNEFGGGFEVLSGLKEGEKVIVEGLMSQGARLRPGAPVAIAGAAAPPAGSPGEAQASAQGEAPAAGPPEAAAGVD
ncbi:MAG: efflux RND transporter periplasmic adaptor subunit [Deltaproteobacteria bacterium]|jgi:membrane fusion protein (multidrug efflux system)|nr:efflux RND transporter periplasmic adaptor subunit [Deltaproteobacteria bacterium]